MRYVPAMIPVPDDTDIFELHEPVNEALRWAIDLEDEVVLYENVEALLKDRQESI